ncbi:MAG: family 43 glycosylhydrolase [Bacteroidaceae bacterium]|nr:family 43 glycosylhydrolase [Bacteroidaceae bacterium]
MKKLFVLSVFLLGAMAGQSQNPYLPLWEHLPDGEPRVFEDPDNPGKLRAYIIGSHDTHYSEYCGNDIRMWSAPVEDLTQWRDEGPIFSWYVNGRWDTMFAPDLVEVKDKTGKKTYWLYPHSRGWGRVAMVCKGDRPNGPFTPVNLTPDGTRCVEGSLIDFDPSVFVENITDKKDKDFDKGFRAYVFYGFQHSTACELDQSTMFSKRPGTELIDPFIPASSHDGRLLDKEGSQYKALYEGQNPLDFNFFEASSIRQVGNKYVMVFSGYSGKEYGLGNTNSALRYAYGDSPLGPWRSGGVLVDSRGVVLNEDGSHLITTNFAHNTHGSLQEINGQWYVFYHRPPRGFANARQAMVAPVKIEWDKKPVSKGGQVRITGYDPFAPKNEWTAKAADGNEYTGAEVTSEGFQIFGLPPYQYYSAGIACFLAGPGSNECMQDNHDVWDNSMDLAGLKNGTIIGYKYFGFGGLDKDAKGLKAFGGTRQGDNTHLNLFLTPGGRAFSIHVRLDNPWKGQEIGVVGVAAEGRKEPMMCSLRVPDVEGLTGKHAVYLVVEGPEVEEPQQGRQFGRRQQPERPQGLFDLHGIGFSKGGAMRAPVVPQVNITLDGKPLVVPAKPIFSSNANGYTDVTHYQVYAPLKSNSVLKATSENPSVTFQVSPVTDGRATVRATYQGKEKVFLIN